MKMESTHGFVHFFMTIKNAVEFDLPLLPSAGAVKPLTIPTAQQLIQGPGIIDPELAWQDSIVNHLSIRLPTEKCTKLWVDTFYVTGIERCREATKEMSQTRQCLVSRQTNSCVLKERRIPLSLQDGFIFATRKAPRPPQNKKHRHPRRSRQRASVVECVRPSGAVAPRKDCQPTGD